MQFLQFRFSAFCVSVKVKLSVSLLCVCVHSVWKGRPRMPEMTYTVSGGR